MLAYCLLSSFPLIPSGEFPVLFFLTFTGTKYEYPPLILQITSVNYSEIMFRYNPTYH